MADKGDFKSLFKAAKSARGGAQKLVCGRACDHGRDGPPGLPVPTCLTCMLQSKEQIKALKAQKAAAQAAQEAERPAQPSAAVQVRHEGGCISCAAAAQLSALSCLAQCLNLPCATTFVSLQGEHHAPQAAASSEHDARSMPPPPPRQPSAATRALPQNSAASFHADSQATRLNMGSAVAPAAHPEPSVNQRAGGGGGGGGVSSQHRSSRSVALPSEEVRSSHPEALPAGFFQSSTAGGAAAAPAAVGSTSPHAAEPPQQAQQAEAISWEGSTGAVAGSGNTTADLTSALSSHGAAQHTQQQGAAAQFSSAVSGVPAGFFEASTAAEPAAMDSVHGTAAEAAAEGQAGEGQAGALPKGGAAARLLGKGLCWSCLEQAASRLFALFAVLL